MFKSTEVHKLSKKGSGRMSSWESKSSVSDGERRSYVQYINHFNPPLLADISFIDPDSEIDLFQIASQGELLCRLINRCFPKTINEKRLVSKTDRSKFETNINHDLAIQACKELGCSVVNIGAEDLSSGKPQMVLGLLWQIIKKALLSTITAKDNSDLIHQLSMSTNIEEGKDSGVNLEEMTPEQMIMYWINFHLKAAKYPKTVRNFTTDVQNSQCYAILLGRLAPNIVSQDEVMEITTHPDLLKRSEMVINAAARALPEGESLFVSPEDIVTGNPRLNLAFVATLFNGFVRPTHSGNNKTPKKKNRHCRRLFRKCDLDNEQ